MPDLARQHASLDDLRARERESAASARPRLGHVPALDGIRGIAAIAVIGFHLHLISGGSAGVTLFFTLSGFLITSLLLQEYNQSGSISFRNFYVRRALRLLPALLVLLIVDVIFVLIYREGWSKKGDLAAAAVALFYVSNWVQAWRLLPLNQLSHTWSLGIEEQFYLLWPVVLLLLCRLRLRPTRLMAAITVAAVASSVWRFVLMYAGASSLRLYNGSDTRADALLFGAAGAVLFGEGLLGHPRRPRPVMAAAGTAALAIIIGYFFVGDADVPHSTSFSALSSHTAIGILGTIVILGLTCSGGANDWMHSILGWRPLRYVGQISYGLYLWHVMILAMLDASGFAGENWIRALIVAAATLGVSVLSYNHVEAPCLRLKHAFAARTGPVPG